jgi:hypothetical protein
MGEANGNPISLTKGLHVQDETTRAAMARESNATLSDEIIPQQQDKAPQEGTPRRESGPGDVGGGGMFPAWALHNGVTWGLSAAGHTMFAMLVVGAKGSHRRPGMRYGESDPPIRKLVAWTGWSKDSIHRGTVELIEREMITVRQVRTRTGSLRNVYRVNYEDPKLVKDQYGEPRRKRV